MRILQAILISSLLATAATSAPVASYRQHWRDAGVDQRIDRNIEKYRKGDATLEVVDAASKPVSGATIEARQTTHEFLFGCNAFVLGQLDTPEKNRRYEEAFVKLFNFATVPFYWEGTEPARGELRYAEPARDMWRRPPPDRFLPWAATNGITLKGHPLLWHAYNPAWLPKDADELRALYRKRFREIASRYGSKISIWDVVNESQAHPKAYPLYTPDLTYVAWAFNEAVPLFPGTCTMMINDYAGFDGDPETSPYFKQIKSLLAQGVKVQGVGFQFHRFRRNALDGYLSEKPFKPGNYLDRYDKFSELGLPLFITEITIPSAGEDGEQLQAEVVRDHYRLWFSAPKMAGITWWNLGDGTAVKGENEAKGGLVDADFNPKTAYRELDRLINQEWKTTLTLNTDAGGKASFRGFHGKYSVKVTSGGVTQVFPLELKSSAAAKRVTLNLK